MKYILNLFLILSFFFIVGCVTESASWKEKDMMVHGLPMKMNVPEDVTVKKSSFSNSEEFQLSGSEGYNMTVLMLDATSSNVETIKNELEKLVSEGKYFDSFVKTEPNGFVYQLRIDSTRAVYGFRKIKIQGEKQFIFQNPYMSKLDEEMALELYDSVSD